MSTAKTPIEPMSFLNASRVVGASPRAAEVEREKPFIGWKPIALEAVTENHKKKAPGMLESQLDH